VLFLAGCSGGSSSASGSSTTSTASSSATSTTTIAPAIERKLVTTQEQVANLPGFDIIRPEDLAALGRPLPVIVWANGGCYRYDTVWLPLLKRLAAAGNIVVAITTPPGADPQTAGPSTANDQAKGIDWALRENARPSSPFAGHLDTKRIVAAGNSCGGITALSLAAKDPRVRAVFVLSGSSVPPGGTRAAAAEIMDHIKVPVAYVTGGPTDISRVMVQQDYDLVSGAPAYVARRRAGDHVMVSTNTAVLAEVADIGINWLDYMLYGTPQARANLLPTPCSTCPVGTWSVRSKDFHVPS